MQIVCEMVAAGGWLPKIVFTLVLIKMQTTALQAQQNFYGFFYCTFYLPFTWFLPFIIVILVFY